MYQSYVKCFSPSRPMSRRQEFRLCVCARPLKFASKKYIISNPMMYRLAYDCYKIAQTSGWHFFFVSSHFKCVRCIYVCYSCTAVILLYMHAHSSRSFVFVVSVVAKKAKVESKHGNWKQHDILSITPMSKSKNSKKTNIHAHQSIQQSQAAILPTIATGLSVIDARLISHHYYCHFRKTDFWRKIKACVQYLCVCVCLWIFFMLFLFSLSNGMKPCCNLKCLPVWSIYASLHTISFVMIVSFSLFGVLFFSFLFFYFYCKY